MGYKGPEVLKWWNGGIVMADHWVSVTGSRHYPLPKKQWDQLGVNEQLELKAAAMRRFNLILGQIPRDWGIVSGGAKGPDSWAEQYAEENGIEIVVYPAEWDKYGRGAGHHRNALIAKHADMCLVFWDGVSPGTNDFIRKAFRLRREIHLIGPSGDPWAVWDEDFWNAHPEKNPRMDIP